MKQQDIDDFMEIPDEIPFKKVEALKLMKVSFLPETDSFLIRIEKKCEGLPKQTTQIERTLDDMNWLLDKLERENKYNLIVPALPLKSYWESIRSLTQNLAKSPKTKIKKEEEKQFLCQCIKRFFCLLGEVVIKNLKKKTVSSYNSIFTFIDQKYKLYRLQVYQKDDTTGLAKISQRFTTGSKKLFGYINPWKNNKKSYLDEQDKKLNKLIQKTKIFRDQMNKLDANYKLLSDNFFNEQNELRDKEVEVFSRLIKFESLLKLLELIKLEFDHVLQRSHEEKNSLDEAQIREQLRNYEHVIEEELKELEKSLNDNIKEFYLILREKKTVQISIGNIYHSSQPK